MNKQVTVVVCLYNAEKYIVETLKSLENQTFKEFNLLIIDDCSTDQSLYKVKEYLKNASFKESKVIEFKENKGTAFIRNFALNEVETPLMMFFDADDVAKPNLIQKLYSKLNGDENIIAVSCYSSYIDSNSNKIKGGHYIGPTTPQDFFNRAENGKFILMPCTALIMRDYAIKAGGYRIKGFEKGKIRYQDLSEDLDLWSRMSDFYIDNKIMITIPEVLFFYRKNTHSLSASKDSLFAMQNKIRYIKFNLKRRRSGKLDIDFIDYMVSLSDKEKKQNYKKDISAYYYRKAGFLYVNKSYLKFASNIIRSIFYNPSYIIDKVKSNFLR